MANKNGNPDIVELGKETQFKSGSRAAVENGKKGGDTFAKNEKQRKKYAEAYDVYMKKGEIQDLVIMALIDRALGEKNEDSSYKRPPDVKAIELLLAMADEMPKEKIEVSTPNTEALESFKKAYYEERDRQRKELGIDAGK